MFKGKKNNLTLSQPAASISNQLENMDLAFPQKKCGKQIPHLRTHKYAFPGHSQIACVFSTHLPNCRRIFHTLIFFDIFCFSTDSQLWNLICGIFSMCGFFFYPHDRPICGKQNSTQQFHRSGNVEMLNSSMRRYQQRYIAQEFSQALQVQNLGTEINTIQQLAGTCIRELRWALVWLSRLNNSDQ